MLRDFFFSFFFELFSFVLLNCVKNQCPPRYIPHAPLKNDNKEEVVALWSMLELLVGKSAPPPPLSTCSNNILNAYRTFMTMVPQSV